MLNDNTILSFILPCFNVSSYIGACLDSLLSQDIPHEEALKIVEGVRRQALKMFPGKDEAFEIIYIPRFRRALNNKYHRA